MTKTIGEHTYYTLCRFCGGNTVETVIDLGHMPLAGGFIKNAKKLSDEKQYPLTIGFCKTCLLLQCREAVHPSTLFEDYFYVSSSMKTLRDHFENTAKEVKKMFDNPDKKFIVEIGCNDGEFLLSLQKNAFHTVGVDPAKNIVQPLIKKGYPIINDFFGEKTAKKIKKEYGKADAIYSFHAMAHIENMHDVMKGVKMLLKKDGFLAFEVHYLGKLLQEFQYDMIYHEHEFYYSLLALRNFFKQYEMEIFDVKALPVRAGSMTYFVQNKTDGKRNISGAVKKLLQEEKKQGLHKVETYRKFYTDMEKTKKELLKLLQSLKSENKTIAGYGASGRGTIIMNYCGLNNTFLEYVIDDAPAKHGSYTPGTHLAIRNGDILQTKERPDYVVLFAWPFFEEVKKKNKVYLEKGGKFIIPLPKVKVIEL